MLRVAEEVHSSSSSSSILTTLFDSGAATGADCWSFVGPEVNVVGGNTSLVFEPSGPSMLPSRPGRDALARLKGLDMMSESSGAGEAPSGGVPAFACVELTDLGVPAGDSSVVLRYGDLRVAADSLSGSAECWRLSCSTF